MHFCSPCDGKIGCHSCPFSCTVLATLQPPCVKISSTDLIVPRFDPSSPINSGSCAFFSAGDFFIWKYSVEIWVLLDRFFKLFRLLTSGQTRQHAVLFGRYAIFSGHASAGHWTRGHLISNVVELHVQMAHRSKPFGGKYGYHDEPAEWNWSPNRQPRGILYELSESFDAACEKEKKIANWKDQTKIDEKNRKISK